MPPMLAWPARPLLSGQISRLLHVGRRGALGTVLIAGTFPAWAGCDNAAPTTGQTVTCSNQPPNPDTVPVIGVAGSSSITLNVLGNAQLASVTGNAITLQAGGGGHLITNDGSILAGAGRGLQLDAASTVINRGVISGSNGGIVFGAGNDRLEMRPPVISA